MRTIRDEDEYDGDGDDPVSLGQGRAVHETERALLIELDSEDEGRWIPRSQIHDDSEVFSCDEEEREGDVIVRRWWAEKEGLA